MAILLAVKVCKDSAIESRKQTHSGKLSQNMATRIDKPVFASWILKIKFTSKFNNLFDTTSLNIRVNDIKSNVVGKLKTHVKDTF